MDKVYNTYTEYAENAPEGKRDYDSFVAQMPLLWKMPCVGCAHLSPLDDQMKWCSYKFPQWAMSSSFGVSRYLHNPDPVSYGGGRAIWNKQLYGPFVENPTEILCEYKTPEPGGTDGR